VGCYNPGCARPSLCTMLCGIGLSRTTASIHRTLYISPDRRPLETFQPSSKFHVSYKGEVVNILPVGVIDGAGEAG
jgi:hypothetical protein